jgi:sugar phosphate isomerase/epimerase
MSLAETIELAGKTGYDSVVFDIKEAETLAQEIGADGVKDLFTEAGVKPASWNCAVSWSDDSKRDDDLKLLPDRAKLARAIGTDRAQTGVMPGHDERDFDTNWEFTVSRIRPVAEVLKDEGCWLGIEFIAPKTLRARFKYEFVYDLPGMMKLIGAIGTGNMGLVLDAWHLYTAHNTVADMANLKESDVVVVHVNDAPAGIEIDEQQDLVRLLPLESGVIDIVPFMQKLQAIGYDGPVMPEPFSKRVEEIAAKDPEAAAIEVRKSLDKLWEASFGAT